MWERERIVRSQSNEGSGPSTLPEEEVGPKLSKDATLLIGKSSPDESLQIIGKTFPPGSELPEGVLHTVMARGQSVSERRHVLDECKRTYAVALGPMTLNSLLQKATSLNEAREIIQTVGAELSITPDETTLLNLIQHAGGFPESCAEIKDFRKRFGSIRFTTRTLNTCLNKLHALRDSEKTILALAHEYGVEPDVGTYKVALFKVLSVARPDRNTLRETRQIIQKLEEMGFGINTQLLGKDNPFKVRYARYLFLEGRPTDAIALLAPMLQTDQPDGNSRRIAIPMLFAFLPAEHPVRRALESSLRQRGLGEIVDSAMSQENNFDDIFAAWLENDTKMKKDHYGGGTIFDDLHTNPINRQAAREIFPKPEG